MKDKPPEASLKIKIKIKQIIQSDIPRSLKISQVDEIPWKIGFSHAKLLST